MNTASPQTIANLNAAFQGESNASHRYAAFARHADAQGFPYEARLFRAASRAESIHAAGHAKTITALDGTVDALKLEPVQPGAVAENLQAAIAGETHEFTVMYPEFLQLAESEDCKPALRSMSYAMAVEKQHAALYQAALDNLGQNADRAIYVCPVCGETVLTVPEKCSVCGAAGRVFVSVE